MKKKALIAMLLACSFAFGTFSMTACNLIDGSDDGEHQEQGDTTVAVTGVTLNKNVLNLKVNGSETLTATVAPTDATTKTVSWSSSSDAVATVDQSGKVTAHAVGSATITVTTDSGNKTDICTVNVTDDGQGGDTVSVTGVSLNKKTLPLTAGGTETLTATVAPTDANNKSVSWSSSNTSVATVSQSGLVTAKSAGTATITVTTADGGFTDTCTVTVASANVAVTGVQLNKQNATIKVDETVKLTATISPDNATNKSVTYSSGNTAVATVDNSGLVTAKSVGTAVITVTTADGNKTATCTVTVEAKAIATVKVTGVELDKKTASIKVNQTVQLTETVAPADASNKAVTWLSGNTAVATVDNSGLVTAKSAGTATITVKTADGNFTDACTVTVQQNASDPVVDAKISYSYAGNECAAFEWSDSNASGATVEYKLSTANSYTALSGNDKQYLVRQKNATTARVDFVGLKGGAVYDFKITPSSGAAMTVSNMTVNSYDRSGYAHFGKSDGVGAYKDDGTPKNNAVIVYVNEANKNTVKATVNGKERTGIVSILQNAGTSTPLIVRIVGTVGAATWNKIDYNADGTWSQKNKMPKSEVKGANGKAIPSAMTQAELIAGGYNTLNETVYTELNGLNSKITESASEFDSCWNDCPISGVKNVTVEGIGEDARIFQWGMTFKNSSSIEVRNLTFEDYTEDACSFEGSETGVSSLSEFKSGNIWVHHNTFEEGVNYWDVCSEQDKHDGDGSTDFKGLKNITISYNVYNGTHKTGLIGGDNKHTTANVTFHHNAYNACKSRLPLARQANMHMYNNYYNGTTSTDISLRAGAYALVENCYFSSTKSVNFDLQNDSTYGKGAAKVLGCTFAKKNVVKADGVSDDYFKENVARDATITNDNKFSKTFDTDSSVFYYDATNKKSNVSVMFTAQETKTYVPELAGVQKRGGDVTLGGAGSGSGSGTGTGTETPGPTPSGSLTNSATVVGAKTANTVLLEVKNGGSTVAKATLLVGGGEKSGGTLEESNGSTQTAEGHIQLDNTGSLKLELAEGYTYTVTVYAGSSSNTATRDITINDVTKTTGIGSVCKALTWNLTAGTYTSTETGKIRIAKIVIVATPV